MTAFPNTRPWQRAAILASLCLALGLAAWQLRIHGPSGLPWMPGCIFHRLTGLHCPGCGMTRATHALLHGHPLVAFRFNPVGIILLPIALVGLGLELAGWARGKPLSFHLNPGTRGAWIIAWTVLAFWFLRNLPWWPFTLLAPPG